MKLVDRVSIFFLATLAVVLLGISVAVYLIVRDQLYDRFDEQLQAAFHTLVAAIEVETDDVKWEPSDHTVTLGRVNEPDEARWVVVDEAGQIMDRSGNLGDTPSDRQLLELALKPATAIDQKIEMPPWRVMRQTLAAVEPKAPELRDPLERERLTVTAAMSTERVETALTRLAIWLSILSPATWLLTAICGRWIVRRALAPLTRMTTEVRQLGPVDSGKRLPVRESRDELAELAISFNDLLDRLFDAFDRQRRFAGDAAHQLRTPLTVLLGETDVALRKPRTAEEYARTLEVLRGQIVQLNEIVESLLLLARPEPELSAVDFDDVELRSWLEEYLLQWKTHPRRRDLSLEPSGKVSARISQTLLAQVLDNLISNAFKYSEPGSPVLVTLVDRGQQVAISVADRGMGISRAEQRDIFQAFYRSQNARQSGQPGVGLGLTIVARLVEALGGKIACESEPGRGTTFRVELPKAR